jgi:hypothetical protein
MDNKQNRQFYWEVKQFLSNNNTPAAPEVKKTSVKDAIKGVLSENNQYQQTAFIKETGTNDVVRSYLTALGNIEKKNNPNCVAYTKNAVSNPFNLAEDADLFSGRNAPRNQAEREEAAKKWQEKHIKNSQDFALQAHNAGIDIELDEKGDPKTATDRANWKAFQIKKQQKEKHKLDSMLLEELQNLQEKILQL